MALSSAFVLAMGGLAHADQIRTDVATVGGVTSRTITSGGTTTVNYYIFQNGSGGLSGCDATVDSPVTVTIVKPANVDAEPGSLEFSSCGEVNDQAVVFSSTTPDAGYAIGATATDDSGRYVGGNENWTLVVQDPAPLDSDGDGDGVADSTDNCVNDANADQADTDGDGIGDACDSNSFAPARGDQAPDADGYEGNTVSFPNPATSGSFTDADGDGTLTLSIGDDDAGDLVDNGGGTFSWSHTTTDDDLGGTVTVTATDGEHTDATQSFDWSAANVAPVIDTISTTATGPCSVGLSADFSDQGSGDTHVGSINWGDGGGYSVPAATTSSVTGSHTYTANGSYTIGVTVTDDDGDTGTENASSAFAAKSTPSAIMQPINAAGTRSVFKLGSTIPVKITVTGCDGLAVTNLTPTVSLINLDSVADGYVNETTVSTNTPTTGTTMRWSDTQYIYNLSTKNSQLNGGAALPGGSYKVTVSDPSFYSSTSALFDLKK